MVESQPGRLLAIDTFSGSYFFLSNDALFDVYYEGQFFPSVSCALLAAEFQLTEKEIEELNRSFQTKKNSDEALEEVKKQYSLHRNTSHWEKIRENVMERLVRDKFRRHQDLRKQLVETGDRSLLWVNRSDDFFGMVENRGSNHLGRLLMTIRQNINEGSELKVWLKTNIALQLNSSLRPHVTLLESKDNDIYQRHFLDHQQPFWMVGKSDACVIRPPNPTVSRVHGLLAFDDSGDLLLVDLKSTVGTFLNQEKLSHHHIPYTVKNGSVLQFGSSSRTYTVEIDVNDVNEYLLSRQRELQNEIKTLTSCLENATENRENKKVEVFIRGLHPKTTREDLLSYFQSCGDVVDLILPLSRRNTPDSDSTWNRGFCIIRFSHPKEAARAVEKHGLFFNKRPLIIDYAEPRPPKETFRKSSYASRPFRETYVSSNSLQHHPKSQRFQSRHSTHQESSGRKTTSRRSHSKEDTSHFHRLKSEKIGIRKA